MFLENLEHGDLYTNFPKISFSGSVENETLEKMDMVTLTRDGKTLVKTTDNKTPAGFIIAGQGKDLVNQKFKKGRYVEVLQEGRIFLDLSKMQLSNDQIAGSLLYWNEGQWVVSAAAIESFQGKSLNQEKSSFADELKSLEKNKELKDNPDALLKSNVDLLNKEIQRQSIAPTAGSESTETPRILLETKLNNGWGCFVKFF